MLDANRTTGRCGLHRFPQGPGRFSPQRPRRNTIWQQDSRNFRISSPMNQDEGPNRQVDLARIAWSVTVLLCLIAVVILVLQGYLGYAAVTFAVAVAAAINLT